MSDRLTAISLPRVSGIADRGLKTPEEMIKQMRQYADALRKEVAQIDAAKDEDFLIETYVGVHVRKNLKVLQCPKGEPK
jgi:hypothetical protein